MQHVWQIIDVFESRGRTILTVWDSDISQRKTLTLPETFPFRVGQLIECRRLPGGHVRVEPLWGNTAIRLSDRMPLPVNAEATVQMAIAV